MYRYIIDNVQQFLTVVEDDGDRVSQIVNVQFMLLRHPPETVISFLKDLYKYQSKKLGKLIRKDPTSTRVNDIVVKMFRLKMAINTIKRHSKEVKAAWAS